MLQLAANLPAEAPLDDVGLSYWIYFVGGVCVLLFLDLAVFHRKAHRVSTREALWWTVFWVSLAFVFNIWVYYRFGEKRALEFLAGYVIEEALSVDNIFVFVVIFRYFQVKPEYQHRILFWGILGAIVFRMAFVLLGAEVVRRFDFMIYVLGAFLIFTGYKLLTHKEVDVHPERNWAVRIFRRFVPTTNEFDGPRFLVKREGRVYATPLFLVLIVVETTDVIFAVDSVPAILAITTHTFIVFTSNVFAILGLRSLYFLLAGMMDVFRYLKFGLSLVLVFVGFKMVIKHVYDMPIGVALGVVAGILGTSIMASIVRPAPPKPEPGAGEPGAPESGLVDEPAESEPALLDDSGPSPPPKPPQGA